MSRWKELRGSYDRLCAGNGVHDAIYVDRYYDTLKYILEGHADEGQQHYKPYSDRASALSEKDGKKVFARRSPHLEGLEQMLVNAGYREDLALNGGRACFCLLRKLTPDGIFDRELRRNGCRVCYYRNRIWDTPEPLASTI